MEIEPTEKPQTEGILEMKVLILKWEPQRNHVNIINRIQEMGERLSVIEEVDTVSGQRKCQN